MGFVSGETLSEDGLPHGFREYGGVKHSQYNDLVREQLTEYMKENKITAANKMTDQQMQEFAERMRDGKLHNGEKPGRFSKYRKIGKFNDAVRAERKAFENASKRAAPIKNTIEANKERGKWYRGNTSRLASALLLSLLAEAAFEGLGIANAAANPPDGQRPYFRDAIESLSKGDLSSATKSMVGNENEHGFGGFVGQVNAAGHAKGALIFSKWWEEKVSEVVESAKKILAQK
jgi:hypothetical protein